MDGVEAMKDDEKAGNDECDKYGHDWMGPFMGPSGSRLYYQCRRCSETKDA